MGLYMLLQQEEILGDENRYYAGLSLGHEPTPEEAAWHYIKCGGAKNFFQKFACLQCEQNRQCCLKKK